MDDATTATIYTTLAELIAREIADALAGADCTAEAVADELRERGLIEWHEERDEDGRIWNNHCGFRMTATSEEFWEAVQVCDQRARRIEWVWDNTPTLSDPDDWSSDVVTYTRIALQKRDEDGDWVEIDHESVLDCEEPGPYETAQAALLHRHGLWEGHPDLVEIEKN